MDDSPPGKLEQLNSSMRAFCLGILVLPFAFAFLWGVLHNNMLITTGEYIGIMTLALTWFFKSRDEKAQQNAAGKTQVNTPSGTVTTMGATTKVDMPAAPGETKP